MKAIVVEKLGSMDDMKLSNIDVPRPDAGEVLVKIKYAAVNPFDWKVVAYAGMAEQFGFQAPLIPGSEFSGVVETVGTGISRFVVGDAVLGGLGAYGGAYAEYIVVNENSIVAKPDGIDFQTAAALGVGGRTASVAIFDHAGLQKGQKILVHGASGGVGSMAVQLAKNIGAYVIATASAANREMVQRLGADVVIDYQEDDFVDLVHDVDVVLDTVGGNTLLDSYKVLKKGGYLVSITAPPSEELKRKYEINGSLAVVDGNRERLEGIVKLVATNQVRPLVETVFALEDVYEAFALGLAGNRKGKILLAPHPEG